MQFFNLKRLLPYLSKKVRQNLLKLHNQYALANQMQGIAKFSLYITHDIFIDFVSQYYMCIFRPVNDLLSLISTFNNFRSIHLRSSSIKIRGDEMKSNFYSCDNTLRQL